MPVEINRRTWVEHLREAGTGFATFMWQRDCTYSEAWRVTDTTLVCTCGYRECTGRLTAELIVTHTR